MILGHEKRNMRVVESASDTCSVAEQSQTSAQNDAMFSSSASGLKAVLNTIPDAVQSFTQQSNSHVIVELARKAQN